MPATASTKRWRWSTGAVLLLLGVTIVTSAIWFVAQPVPSMVIPGAQPTSTPTPVKSPSPTPIPTPTTTGTIAVLGDSFVRGVGATTDYVTVLGQLLGVTTAKFGETGTGLVNYGTGLPYDQRLASLMYTQPVALVVQASVNDYQATTESVVAAAKVLVTHARSIDKDIPIAIVGPIYYQYAAQPALLSQRLALKQLARELKITYVDPTGWITDATKATYIGSDNLHPTAAGYQRIASQLALALRQFAADLP